MRFRVLLGSDMGFELMDLTYPELVREVDRLLYEAVRLGLSGIEISFIEEVSDEGQGSENFEVG